MENKKLIKVLVFSKKVKTERNTFTAFYTKMKLADENGEVKERFVTLKFRRSVDTKSIKRGVIYCKPEDINAPFKYVVSEENGKKVYPEVWIRGMERYEEKISKHVQNDFVVDEEDTETELPFEE